MAEATHRVVLKDYVDGAGRATFAAEIGGRPALIELDGPATLKLVDHALGEARIAALAAKRGLIRDTAQRLVDGGFFVEKDGRLEVMITALDL
ncbi:MAG: hypothetical protein ABW128_16290 [Rhizorhabdus sp.]